MIKKILIGLFVILCITVGIFHFFVYPSPDKFPLQDKSKPILIAHAGGAYEGKTYTNSIEALSNSMQNGYNFIEIDLLLLSDDKLGGVHELDQFNEITGFNKDYTPVSSKDLKERRIYGNLHALQAEDIVDKFKNSDAYLVTDKTDDPRLIERDIPLDKKKMLVEAFSYKAYLNLLKNGYHYPMLCIGDKHSLDHYQPLFITGKVKMITIPVELIAQAQNELESLINKGVAIFAFTSNDIEFMKKYGGTAVTGFYTDSITYKDLSR